jgi:hypothetical protein
MYGARMPRLKNDTGRLHGLATFEAAVGWRMTVNMNGWYQSVRGVTSVRMLVVGACQC